MMDSKITFGSFNKNTQEHSKSIDNYDKFKKLFAFADNTHNISCELCHNKCIFGSFCINCLNYQKYKYTCNMIAKAATNIDHCFAVTIKKLQIDITCCIIESIKVKIYNEIIKAIQQERPKVAYFWLNNSFYVLLHFSNDDIIPDGLKSLLENILGKHEYALYHCVMSTPNFCLRFQFVLRIGEYMFMTNTYVTTDSHNVNTNDNEKVTTSDLNEENTVVISINGQPTKHYIENWGNKLKEYIFDNIVKKVCATRVQKNITEANLSLFIKRCQDLTPQNITSKSKVIHYSKLNPCIYFKNYERIWGKLYFDSYDGVECVDYNNTHFKVLTELYLFFKRYYSFEKKRCVKCDSIENVLMINNCFKCLRKSKNNISDKMQKYFCNVLLFIQYTMYDDKFVNLILLMIDDLNNNIPDNIFLNTIITHQIQCLNNVMDSYIKHHK
jgi:hypothetical protein